MTYHPLPPYLTIRPSEIHGLGLFATEDIPAITDLGVTHILINHEWFRTPLGGFYNHSESPNTASGSGICRGFDCRFIATMRDISAGEEITCRYTLYDPTEGDG